MMEKLESVLRRFPNMRETIVSLADRDEDFRSLCVDLADAEAALQQSLRLPSPMRERRRDDYLALIDSLTAELAAMWQAGKP